MGKNMPDRTFEQIRNWLEANAVPCRAVHHGPTRTSEESAKARGEDLKIGGKALLVKTDDAFRIFVLSAALKLDIAAMKKELGFKKSRFATPEELMELTGLVPGAVPPFGPPILPFELFVDLSVTANDKIAFNAGSLTDSLVLAASDYLRVANPRIFAFSKP
jgi:Ala-tRNA(Pro) deacylase